jgi:hypothetical protein
MADEKKLKEMGRELADKLGIDLEHPETNDTDEKRALVSEYNVMLERFRNILDRETGDPETPVTVKPGETSMLADAIRELADQTKQARTAAPSPTRMRRRRPPPS